MMILYSVVMLVVSESLLFFGRVTREVYLESLPVVVATVLPFRSLMELMPELAFTWAVVAQTSCVSDMLLSLTL